MDNPGYFAVIPADVRYSDVKANAKLLYGEITALANKTGFCFAGNKYFADLYGTSEKSISRRIKELENAGFIFVTISKEEGNKRYIAIDKNVQTLWTKKSIAMDKNVGYNNTDNKTMKKTNKSNILSKDNSEAETYGRDDINNLIKAIMNECTNLGIAYNNKKERMFAKHILTAKEFGKRCDSIGQDRMQASLSVIKASVEVKYRKGVASGPMSIYQNYSEIYNKRKETQSNFISTPVI